jgi:hypothetical protein
MTYAFRLWRDDRGRRQVDLFVSETGIPPPPHFVRCSYDRLLLAWRIRDRLHVQQVRRIRKAAKNG